MGNKGSLSVMECLVAFFVLTVTFTFFAKSYTSSIKARAELRERLAADAYASELLELFASMTSTEMLEYLKVNPFSPAKGFDPYPLCAHIGLLDRTTNKVLNAEPLIALTTPQLPSPNRYFQVQVVNAETLDINFQRCRNTAEEVLNNPAFGLRESERLLVTVGVTWTASSMNQKTPKQVVLSTLLARK